MGVGDPFGMAITHAIASGMGGMRTAGDLVARMQIARGMKIGEAKKYVADKLSVAVADLTDPIIMKEVREDLNLGLLHPHAAAPLRLTLFPLPTNRWYRHSLEQVYKRSFWKVLMKAYESEMKLRAF